ncbi:MAG: recombinase family protein [Abitibacteriaceae bacterium]|nr:recombinase family protein [Abditibacteriaceae bacterium]
MKEGLRAVGYGRVSTDEQEKSGTSLRDQFSGNHQKAKEMSASMVAYFEDADSGGFYLTRKGLQDALRTLEEGKANCLIVKDLVRLTRNDRAEQALILKRIKDAGAKLIFWDVTYEDSPLGEFSLNVTGDFAILEKAVIKDRTTRGRRRRAAEGIQPSRQPPFGYYIPKHNDIIRGTYPPEQVGKYILVEERATYAEQAFLRRAGGESYHSLCRWLQNAGVPTAGGGRCWTPTNLKDMFGNHAYYGLAAFGRFKWITDESRALRGLKSRSYKVAVPEEEWIRIPCPAIVSKQIWDKCQQVSRENRAKLSTRTEYRCLLTGMMRCPTCRKVMIGRHRYGARKVSNYMCKEYYPGSNAARHVCNNKHYHAGNTESLIIEAVKKVMSHPQVIEEAYQAYQLTLSNAFSEQEYQRLKRELSDLSREELATAKAQIQGIEAGASTTVYESLLRDLALKRTRLQNQLEDYERTRSEVWAVQDKATLIQQAMQDVEAILDTSEEEILTSEKNAYLLKIIEYIYPTENGFEITFASFDNGTHLVASVAQGQELVIRVEASAEASLPFK